jgi:predicted aldo/keto reductase-like oxidoreductase
MMIDQFVFEAAKERLDEGVIVAVGFAAHGRD